MSSLTAAIAHRLRKRDRAMLMAACRPFVQCGHRPSLPEKWDRHNRGHQQQHQKVRGPFVHAKSRAMRERYHAKCVTKLMIEYAFNLRLLVIMIHPNRRIG